MVSAILIASFPPVYQTSAKTTDKISVHDHILIHSSCYKIFKIIFLLYKVSFSVMIDRSLIVRASLALHRRGSFIKNVFQDEFQSEATEKCERAAGYSDCYTGYQGRKKMF